MDRMKFCEELYASHGDVIIARRRSVIAPMSITVAGAALLVLNALLPDDAELVNLRSVLVLAGAVAAIVGIVMLSARMFGSGVPYHKGCRSYLRGEVLMFDESRRRQVLEAIAAGDAGALLAIPRRNVSSVSVLFYSTPDGSFVAMQPFEYVDLEYRPLGDIKVVR